MPLYNAILTTLKEIRWQEEERSKPGDYWFRSARFPNLRLRSPVQSPFDKAWAISVQDEKGKPKENRTYTLNCRLTLRPLEKGIEPDFEIVWLYDTGLCLKLDGDFLKNAQHSFIFSQAPYGWLALMVRSLPGAGPVATTAVEPPAPQNPAPPRPQAVPQQAKPLPPQPAQPRRSMPVPEPTGGAARINQATSNDARAAEAIAVVTEAVQAIQRERKDWATLTVRQKIDLIRATTKQIRGTAVGQQTLYRDWIIEIWNPRPR